MIIKCNWIECIISTKKTYLFLHNVNIELYKMKYFFYQTKLHFIGKHYWSLDNRTMFFVFWFLLAGIFAAMTLLVQVITHDNNRVQVTLENFFFLFSFVHFKPNYNSLYDHGVSNQVNLAIKLCFFKWEGFLFSFISFFWHSVAQHIIFSTWNIWFNTKHNTIKISFIHSSLLTWYKIYQNDIQHNISWCCFMFVSFLFNIFMFNICLWQNDTLYYFTPNCSSTKHSLLIWVY